MQSSVLASVVATSYALFCTSEPAVYYIIVNLVFTTIGTSFCLAITLKGTLSRNKKFSYMKDITSLNIIHKVKASFEAPFSSKIADLAEIVRLKGPEKQAIVSCSGPEKQAISLL